MPQGYLVTLGNGSLDSGDTISGSLVTFTGATRLGEGSWIWSGVWAGDGNTYNNINEPGVFWQADDGSIYFAPDNWQVTTINSGTVNAIPAGGYSTVISGTTGNDTAIDGSDAAETLYGGTGTSTTNTGNDTITAGAGNDTVFSGDGADIVYGQAGSDSISAGSGDDVVYGDRTDAPARVVFRWSAAEDPSPTPPAGFVNGSIDDNDSLAAGFSQNVNGVTVSYSYQANPAGTTDGVGGTDTAPLYDNAAAYVTGINSGSTPVDSTSANLFGGDLAVSSITLNFSQGVTNVSFRVNDIDSNGVFRDGVQIIARDAAGNPVPVTLTLGSSLTAMTSADAPITTAGTIYGARSGTSSFSGLDPQASMLVNVAGPITSLQIIYSDNLSTGDDGLVQVSDIFFDEPAAPSGNDSIDAGTGNDTVFGEAGDDTIEGGTGTDTIYGGTGNDTITDSGTEGDVIEGGDGNDSISSGAGADLVSGDAGADSIDAGTGNDTVFGGAGNDTIQGGSGTDTIYGGADNDTITDSGTEGDVIEGGDGNDTISSGAGADLVNGDAGADSIDAGTGNDTVFGGTGDDTIRGGTGLDTLYGGADNDSILGDNGNDTLFGDAGADTLSGDAGNDILFGGTGNDTLFGGANNDILDGGADNDVLSGGDGTDTLTGDTGADTLSGDAGDDSLSGGTGNDTLFGGTNNDILDGGADNDTLDGGDGDDTLIASAGDDTAFGGTGSDLFSVSDTSGTETITGGEDPGDTDIDVVSFSAPSSSDGVTVTYSGTEAGTYDFDGTTASGSFSQIERVETTGFDDTINATAATGAVSIVAGAGDDTITGGSGNDTIALGTGVATDGDADRVILTDGFGDDIIAGFDAPTSNGDGTFTGIDTFDVTGLTDTGGAPVNTNDVTVGDDGSGNAVLNFPNGESVTLLGVSPAAADDRFYLNAIGIPLPPADGIVTGTEGADLIDGTYAGDPEGDRVDNGDALLAGEAPNDDIIVARGGDDSISAGAGDDDIYGGDGADSIDGGAGNDTIYGDTPQGAWYFEYHDLDPAGDPRTLAQAGFAAGTTDHEGVPTSVGYTDTIAPTAFDTGDDYALKFTSVLQVTTAGTYTFATTSDDGSKLFINGIEIVNNDGHHGAITVTGTPLSLPAGEHVIEIIYYENNGGNVLTATIAGPDTGGATTDLATYDGLRADTGDDIISGGTGDDTIFGGGGSDTGQGGAADDTDTITGGEDAGDTDIDTVDFSGVATTDGVTVTFTGDEAGAYQVGAAGSDGTFAEIERIVGTDNADSINLTGDSDGITVESGAGDDTVTGGAGSDSISTGAGSDQVTFSNGDTVDTGADDDLLILSGTGPTVNGDITITGGDEVRDGFGNLVGSGDVLQLGELADLSTLTTTTDADGSLSGSVVLDDGRLLTFTDIEQIICFTPGTTIATPRGARPVETLRVGDLVVTRDHGLQPIRWIQARTVPAKGKLAPVRIRPGAVVGLETDLLVSPQHRMLFTGYRAELLFGEREVLMPAIHLVDDKLVTRVVGGIVTYIHMMFDSHEVIYADGAASESFHPGDEGLKGITDAAREELFTIFPELRSDPTGYGPAARRCLKKHETQMLRV